MEPMSPGTWRHSLAESESEREVIYNERLARRLTSYIYNGESKRAVPPNQALCVMRGCPWCHR